MLKGTVIHLLEEGLPGFIRILDEKTLIYPEYMGNGVLASLGNMYENPHIGLLIIDFFESQVGLHINGSVEVLKMICYRLISVYPKMSSKNG